MVTLEHSDTGMARPGRMPSTFPGGRRPPYQLGRTPRLRTAGRRAKLPSKRAYNQLLRAEVEREWNDFPDLPGMHLKWITAGRGSWELISHPPGAMHVRLERKRSERHSHVYISNGRTYAWRNLDEGKRFVRSNQLAEDLVDCATSAPLLHRVGRHCDGQATSRLALSGHGELWFPVRGRPAHALMSATDSVGTRFVEYRTLPSRYGPRHDVRSVDIVISPPALTIPQVELLVAVSAPFLLGYFDRGGGA